MPLPESTTTDQSQAIFDLLTKCKALTAESFDQNADSLLLDFNKVFESGQIGTLDSGQPQQLILSYSMIACFLTKSNEKLMSDFKSLFEKRFFSALRPEEVPWTEIDQQNLQKLMNRCLFTMHASLFCASILSLETLSQLPSELYFLRNMQYPQHPVAILLLTTQSMLDVPYLPNVIDNFDQVITSLHRQLEGMPTSQQEVLQKFREALSGYALKCQVLQSLVVSGDGALRQQSAAMFANYVEMTQGRKNSTTAAGFLMDYILNNNQDSRNSLRSTLIKMDDKEQQKFVLTTCTEALVKEALSHELSRQEELLKYAVYLTSHVDLESVVRESADLRFLKLFSQLILSPTKAKKTHAAIGKIDIREISAEYRQYCVFSYYLGQDIEASHGLTMGYLSDEHSHIFDQKQLVFKFRDYFLYNPDSRHALQDKTLELSAQQHEGLLAKMTDPTGERVSVLRSLLRIRMLQCDQDKTVDIAREMREMADETASLTEQELQAIAKLSAAENFSIDKKIELAEDMGLKFTPEESVVIGQTQSSLDLIAQVEHYSSCESSRSQSTSGSSTASEDRSTMLTVNGENHSLSDCAMVFHEGSYRKVLCSPAVLAKASTHEEKFIEALSKETFAAASGEAGIKILKSGKKGARYELKIMGEDARILGHSISFNHPDGRRDSAIYLYHYAPKPHSRGTEQDFQRLEKEGAFPTASIKPRSASPASPSIGGGAAAKTSSPRTGAER